MPLFESTLVKLFYVCFLSNSAFFGRSHPPLQNPLTPFWLNVARQSVQHFPQTQNSEKL